MGSPDSGLPSCPQSRCQGRVIEGVSGLRLQFRGALGFPALVLPSCAHYLLNHHDSGGAKGEKGLGGGVGQSDPVVALTPDGASNEQDLSGQLSVKAICP